VGNTAVIFNTSNAMLLSMYDTYMMQQKSSSPFLQTLELPLHFHQDQD
jgi:hypothetical protein